MPVRRRQIWGTRPMGFEIGQNIGPYRITAQLGQGGMATVYKAYHANLDRYVAIKVLHIAFREDETFLVRFQREAQIVARLDHPNIVPVYDYADFEGQPYLVMKFVEGQTLKQRMRKQSPTLGEVTEILPVVASALDYAHQQDVLHRDVKPSNVVIEKSGTMYLTDFGLARIASTGESTLSQDMMLGTPQYISPEQAQGSRDLDAGTDIYSLGVVLYELVVGRVPFSADTPYAIIHDHIYKPLPMPRTVNPAVPEAIETVLLKALSKNREDRYRSAGQLAQAFQEAIEGSQMTALSLHTLRLDAFAESQPLPGSQPAGKATSPPPEVAEPAVAQAAPSTPTPAAIPTPAPASMPVTPAPGSVLVPGTPVQQRARRPFASAWALGGCVVFILSCLLSFLVIVSTLNDPKLKDDDVTVVPATPVSIEIDYPDPLGAAVQEAD